MAIKVLMARMRMVLMELLLTFTSRRAGHGALRRSAGPLPLLSNQLGASDSIEAIMRALS